MKMSRVRAGEYVVVDEGKIVGHVFRKGSKTWQAQIDDCPEMVSRYGYSSMAEAFLHLQKAIERGGATIIRLQPAPRPDAAIGDHILTQLPYPLHVRSFSGSVLEDWANRVVGFADEPDRQQVDLYWDQAVQTDPSTVIGKYIIIQQPNGKYATLDTAVQSVDRL